MKALGYLLTIYLIWGSTYLAMRVGVMPGSGFPPFALGALRFLMAGPILILIAYLRSKKIKITSREMKILAVCGLLQWLGGHGLILWGEQYVDSGYTALIIAALPVWVLIIESFLDKKYPDILLTIFILIGLFGVSLLIFPKIKTGVYTDAVGTLFILIGTLSWAVGSIYQQRVKVNLSSLTMSGYQQLFAGVGFVITSLLLKEPIPHPTTSAWIAWAYLMVFGSIIAFTVYVKALTLLPIGVVMTHAYVNPLIAVVLGYLVLSEQITGIIIIGGVVTICSVFGIIVKRGSKR